MGTKSQNNFPESNNYRIFQRLRKTRKLKYIPEVIKPHPFLIAKQSFTGINFWKA